MFFPLSDDDRHLSSPAYVTIVFLIANVVIFLYQLMEPSFTSGWSVIPKEIMTGADLVGTSVIKTPGGPFPIPQEPGPSPIYVTLLSSMFMHGSWMHLGGNMLYLWIFGDNVEHRFGHVRFILFYLGSGLLASAAQIALNTESVIPNLGASGAISGVLGCYLVLFPRNKVNAVFFFRIISVPAIVVLGMWGVMQFVQGAGSLASAGESGGVAYGAHIGGFVAGLLIGFVARMGMKEEPSSILKRQYARDPGARRYW
ncbi:MAG: rhomboid family intramembrane serine protease [Verrucomicrobiaceae bacterium]